MSRIAKKPVEIIKGSDLSLEQLASTRNLKVKGPKGELTLAVHPAIDMHLEKDSLKISLKDGENDHKAMQGTTCVLVKNMMQGVTAGFEKKLTLVGVGYRAKATGRAIDLNLGFSHPVSFALPEGITAETPSATEIVIKGIDKQLVGQVAANIRRLRPPEPYKGKGVRYTGEQITLKETKKK